MTARYGLCSIGREVNMRKKILHGMSMLIMLVFLVITLSHITHADTISKNGTLFVYRVEPHLWRMTTNNSGLALTAGTTSGTQPQVITGYGSWIDLAPTLLQPTIIETRGLMDFKNITTEIVYTALSVVLNNSYGTIDYTSTLDLVRNTRYDLDSYVNISANFVEVKSPSLVEFNGSSAISIKGITFDAVRILQNGSDCTACQLLSFSSGVARFTAPSFTYYSVADGGVLPAIRISTRVIVENASLNITGGTYNASYPSNVTIDLGNDVSLEYNTTGNLTSTVVFDNRSFTNSLNTILDAGCACTGCNLTNSGLTCTISMNVSTQSQGAITFSGLNITQDIKNATFDYGATYTLIDLDDYFYDKDGNPLTYNHTAIENITVSMNNGIVTLQSTYVFNSTEANFNRTIVFIGNDTTNVTYSNNVTIVVTHTPDLCNNGVLDTGETCDGSLGCPSGLTCNACSSCTGGGGGDPVCGNNVIESGEVCDGSQGCDAGETCVSCSSCNGPIPPVCGNDVVETGEVCDGTAGCGVNEVCNNCQVCEPQPFCGNNLVESGETCDGSQGCGADETCSGDCARCITPPIEEEPQPIPEDITHRFCTNSTINFTTTAVPVWQYDLKKLFNIGAEWHTIVKPFQITCGQSPFDVTFSIPNNYTDVRILRCTSEGCVPAMAEFVERTYCGLVNISETHKGVYLKPESFPHIIKTKNITLREAQFLLESGNVSVRFHGIGLDTLTATISMSEEEVPEPANPNLRIVSTPMTIRLGEIRSNISVTVTIPYVARSEIDENALAAYIRKGDEWYYLESTTDKEKKLVTASIDSLQEYLLDGKVTVAIIGGVCIDCIEANLRQVYTPPEGSRDAVILIHGLGSSPETFRDLITDIQLAGEPYEVWVLGYPSSKATDDNAQALMELLEKQQEEFDNIYIVAHSLGGLIAQKAIRYSYDANELGLAHYEFTGKVRKMLLIGVPNEGSPAAQYYRNLLNSWVNDETKASLFVDPRAPVIQELSQGAITPQVPSVRYYVIAGTRPLEFDFIFFKLKTDRIFKQDLKNDGLVTVKSAQRIGDTYIDNLCGNYWEVYLNHPELIDAPLGRRIIGKVLAENIFEEESSILSGFEYLKFTVNRCTTNDYYIVIGKPLVEGAAEDPTLCTCGNGVCGEGEDAYNCPADCGLQANLCRYSLLPILLFLLWCMIVSAWYTYKRYYSEKQISKQWIVVITILTVIIIVLTLQYLLMCKTGLWIFILILLAFILITFVLVPWYMERRKKPTSLEDELREEEAAFARAVQAYLTSIEEHYGGHGLKPHEQAQLDRVIALWPALAQDESQETELMREMAEYERILAEEKQAREEAQESKRFYRQEWLRFRFWKLPTSGAQEVKSKPATAISVMSLADIIRLMLEEDKTLVEAEQSMGLSAHSFAHELMRLKPRRISYGTLVLELMRIERGLLLRVNHVHARAQEIAKSPMQEYLVHGSMRLSNPSALTPSETYAHMAHALVRMHALVLQRLRTILIRENVIQPKYLEMMKREAFRRNR